MQNLREAAQMALEYLEQHAIISGVPIRDALRAALEPVTTCHELSKKGDKLSIPFNHFPDARKMVATIRPEVTVDPVAWLSQGGDVSRSRRYFEEMGFTDLIPLYTALPKREPLTDEEIHDCFQQRHKDKVIERRRIARAIERAHGIGGEE